MPTPLPDAIEDPAGALAEKVESFLALYIEVRSHPAARCESDSARAVGQAPRQSSERPRAQLDQILHFGRAAVAPLIESLADFRLAPLAVTVLVGLGPVAKEQLVEALESPNRQLRIHAGEALWRAGLDEDL